MRWIACSKGFLSTSHITSHVHLVTATCDCLDGIADIPWRPRWSLVSHLRHPRPRRIGVLGPISAIPAIVDAPQAQTNVLRRAPSARRQGPVTIRRSHAESPPPPVSACSPQCRMSNLRDQIKWSARNVAMCANTPGTCVNWGELAGAVVRAGKG